MAEPPSQPPRRPYDLSGFKGVGLVSTVGFTLVICSAIGTGIGYWVDQKWHTSPWGVAIGFLFGTAAGFVEMFRTVMKANDDD